MEAAIGAVRIGTRGDEDGRCNFKEACSFARAVAW